VCDHQQDAESGQEDSHHLEPGKPFPEHKPPQEGHENGDGGSDPAGRHGLCRDEAGGLQPLVESDPQETQQGEVKPVFPLREAKLPASENCHSQDDDPHRKTQPNDGCRFDVPERDLGRHKRSPPHQDGEESFQHRTARVFRHECTVYHNAASSRNRIEPVIASSPLRGSSQ